jgi:hypothetical protein
MIEARSDTAQSESIAPGSELQRPDLIETLRQNQSTFINDKHNDNTWNDSSTSGRKPSQLQGIPALSEQDPEYPETWKLAIIITALCLTIFCVALVSQ